MTDFKKDVTDAYTDAKNYISGKSIDGAVKEECNAGIDRLIDTLHGRTPSSNHKPFPNNAIPVTPDHE